MTPSPAHFRIGSYVRVSPLAFRDSRPRRAILRRILGDGCGRVRVKPIGERETTVYLCDLERAGKR